MTLLSEVIYCNSQWMIFALSDISGYFRYRQRWQNYETYCHYDKITGGCAAGPAMCRSAQIGIMGTVLTTNCTCTGVQHDEYQHQQCVQARRRLQHHNVCMGEYHLVGWVPLGGCVPSVWWVPVYRWVPYVWVSILWWVSTLCMGGWVLTSALVQSSLYVGINLCINEYLPFVYVMCVQNKSTK